MDSVILRNPALMLCLGFAWVMQLIFQKIGSKTGGFQLLPAALCSLCLVWAVLLGAALTEIATVLCMFLILSLTAIGRKNG